MIHDGELDLSVGALVVYGGHGVGRVTAGNAKKSGAGDDATVVLEFASGLSVVLPLERAQACLRPPAGASDLEAVGEVLRSPDIPAEQTWQSRRETVRTKIVAGEAVGLAEVVRDAFERQRRAATGSKPSPAEQELYRKARSLLAAEVAVAAGLDEAEAETWIERQLDRTPA